MGWCRVYGTDLLACAADWYGSCFVTTLSRAPPPRYTPPMSKQPIRAYSGIQPSGAPHLGNDLGAIRNYVALQENYESIYCSAT